MNATQRKEWFASLIREKGREHAAWVIGAMGDTDALETYRAAALGCTFAATGDEARDGMLRMLDRECNRLGI